MRVFPLLQTLAPELTPEACKVHLAVDPTQISAPMEEFLSGNFERWQSLQSNKSFPRPYIVSFIHLPDGCSWLLAGAFEVLGVKKKGLPPLERFQYRTRRIPGTVPLEGRLIADYKKVRRVSYPNGEKVAEDLRVHEILAKPWVVEEFPGYSRVLVSLRTLTRIVKEGVASWEVALSSVGGVYLITDTITGGLFVGSACGEGGFWKRWSRYAGNGHGGNQELRQLLRRNGREYAYAFQYSILELASTHALPCDVQERERHWKRVLCSKEHGLNAN